MLFPGYVFVPQVLVFFGCRRTVDTPISPICVNYNSNTGILLFQCSCLLSFHKMSEDITSHDHLRCRTFPRKVATDCHPHTRVLISREPYHQIRPFSAASGSTCLLLGIVFFRLIHWKIIQRQATWNATWMVYLIYIYIYKIGAMYLSVLSWLILRLSEKI